MASSYLDTQQLSALVLSVSSGTTTSRDVRGKNPLYGSTGRIGSTNRTEFSGPSILVARVGANAGSVYTVDGAYGVTDNTLVIRLRPNHSLPFLAEFLKYSKLNRMVYGTGQPLVTGTMLKNLSVPLLSPAEQAAIADTLGRASEQIGTIESLIAKKQAIKQGMMQQLLTGRTRLPGFEDEWETRKLGELLDYEQPGRYLVSSTDYGDAGIPVLTAGKTFLLGYTSESHGVYEAVPVIIFDDFTTDSKYVDFPFKAKSSAMKMLSARSGTNLRYVFERMQLIDFNAVDHKRRWIAEYSKLDVPVPGPDEQQAIAVVLEDAEHEVKVLQARLAKARDMKTGMMQQLLTGRTRLPVEAVS